MKCYRCDVKIDLEMTPDEEEKVQKELDEHGVIMVCYKCYEPLEGEKQKLIKDLIR